MLTDNRWFLLLQVMKSTGRVYNKPEHRMTFEDILYRLWTGLPWPDLPEVGDWSVVYRRFNLWSKKILNKLFNQLANNADFEWVFIDGLPVYFKLSEGQRHDIVHAENLVQNLPKMKAIIADKGYDSDSFRAFSGLNGGKSIIPKRNYGADIAKDTMDWCLYKYRYLVKILL